jgi:hypothetical protein
LRNSSLSGTGGGVAQPCKVKTAIPTNNPFNLNGKPLIQLIQNTNPKKLAFKPQRSQGTQSTQSI